MSQTVKIQGFGTVQFPDEMTPEQIQSAIEHDILPAAPAPAVQAQAPETVVPPDAPTRLERLGHGASSVLDRAVHSAACRAGSRVPYKRKAKATMDLGQDPPDTSFGDDGRHSCGAGHEHQARLGRFRAGASIRSAEIVC
jgi:hypothetical protein